jgi:hypothetical protein
MLVDITGNTQVFFPCIGNALLNSMRYQHLYKSLSMFDCVIHSESPLVNVLPPSEYPGVNTLSQLSSPVKVGVALF